MSSDNDLSNNDVNNDSGNDFEFVHVPNNGLIPATNVGTKNSGADKLRTGYYEPIKDTGYYDSKGLDIGHLFAAGGPTNDPHYDVSYNKSNNNFNTIKIWANTDTIGKKHDANSGSAGSTPLAYKQYFDGRTYEGEVGPHVQFGGYGAYKWGKNSEGSTGIESSSAEWDEIPIPTINTITGGEQRAKKAVAYIVSSGGSCTSSEKKYWYGHYYSSDGSSGGYGKATFNIGSTDHVKLYLARDNRANTYVKIGQQKSFIKNGDGGARDNNNKAGKYTHSVGSNDSDRDTASVTMIKDGTNSRGGVNRVDFSNDNHPKFNSNTGRGSGSNSDKPGFVGAIQVHFFWD